MERKSRVFVFDRVELSLLVFFFVIMSITAFVLGMRLGKKRALDHVGITEENVREFELKSDKEEYVENVVSEAPATNGEVATQEPQNLDEETFQKLQDEFEKLDRKNFKAPEQDEIAQPAETPSVEKGDQAEISGDIIGKYTVQLGSYKTIEEAQQFAGGFIARGYKPLINEVELGASKSKWYRVSLGAFDSIDAAKSYVKAESSLFNSQEYVITTIK